ncbi:MAG TPA: permease [Pyrinomonadaceae bacterium]|nr:permease [Pyrinomonadaceae bacterium]
MATQIDQNTIALSTQRGQKVIYATILLLVIVTTLFVYKSSAALAVIEKVQNTRTFQPRLNVLPIPGNTSQIGLFARSFNYFSVIWPALLFGILISGAVRVLDPPSWLAKSFGRGRVRSQLAAGLAGAPLMLCSCCVAPVFSGMYERSSKLGPSLAVMLAAPALNPAALILTFMLFAPRIAVTRLVAAGCAVFFTGVLIERFIRVNPINCAPVESENREVLLKRFLRSCGQVAVRTLPLIVVGVLISMAIAMWLPVGSLASSRGQLVATIIVALFAVPLAMPTFFEIPLALLLLSAGAPAGAAVALMIAGPAINLPSLFTIARSTNWKVAGAVAFAIFALAIAAGLVVNVL